jgi:aspartyl-tRNA(Asn)/glutamyl-tRNA(Gln) amidotransferase subunit A
MTNPSALINLSISEAAATLRQGETSSLALTEASLARIQQTEATVNAYATVPAELALEAARQADAELAAGNDRGPLHGIPIGVKDICYTKGVVTEAGSKVMEGFVPDYDSTVVRKLNEAGAIMIGKTRCHEFAYGVNEPPTRSPWELNSYPGGSSTGSGVAVTVRSAYGAIGTDTGGSIRIPASFNNLVGLKPTYGRVSAYGVVPLSWTLDHVGPMTRTVLDNALMLGAIASHDVNDATSAREPVPDYIAGIQDGVDGTRIGIDREYVLYPGVVDDVRAATESVISELADMGAEIIEVSLPEFELTPETLFTIMMVEASTYHRQMLREKGDLYDPTTRATLQLGELVPGTHYVTSLRAAQRYRSAMRDLFQREQLDALISPTMPLPTALLSELHQPRRDMDIGETPMISYIHHTFSANLGGQPAISAPCGFSSAGLPIGYQLMGRPFDEAMLFRIAWAYEQAHDWHQRQPTHVYD